MRVFAWVQYSINYGKEPQNSTSNLLCAIVIVVSTCLGYLSTTTSHVTQSARPLLLLQQLCGSCLTALTVGGTEGLFINAALVAAIPVGIAGIATVA